MISLWFAFENIHTGSLGIIEKVVQCHRINATCFADDNDNDDGNLNTYEYYIEAIILLFLFIYISYL